MGEAQWIKPEEEFLTYVLFFPCSPGQPPAMGTGCHCSGCISSPGGHCFRGQQVLVQGKSVSVGDCSGLGLAALARVTSSSLCARAGNTMLVVLGDGLGEQRL
ncbi:hypothetical protein Nmel_011277, partial [Mimus melanotis]